MSDFVMYTKRKSDDKEIGGGAKRAKFVSKDKVEKRRQQEEEEAEQRAALAEFANYFESGDSHHGRQKAFVHGGTMNPGGPHSAPWKQHQHHHQHQHQHQHQHSVPQTVTVGNPMMQGVGPATMGRGLMGPAAQRTGVNPAMMSGKGGVHVGGMMQATAGLSPTPYPINPAARPIPRAQPPKVEEPPKKEKKENKKVSCRMMG